MKRKPALRMIVPRHGDFFDRIIIGGGLAGLSVAFSAAQKGAGTTLILEAGPTGPLQHLDANLCAMSGLAYWCRDADDPYAIFPQDSCQWQGVTRHVFGGRGLYWGGVLCPINPRELAGDERSLGWLDRIGFGGSAPRYQKTIVTLGSIGAFRAGGKHLPFEAGANQFRTIARAVNIQADTPFPPVEYFENIGSKTASTYLTPYCTARGLRFQGGEAIVKIALRGSDTEVRAKHLVLAAGLIENCKIINTHVDTKEPYTFTEHLVAGAVCFAVGAKHERNMATQAATGDVFFCDRSEKNGFNIFIAVTPKSSGYVVDVWGMGEKTLSSPIRLYLQGSSVSKFVCRKDQADIQKERDMIKECTSVLRDFVMEEFSHVLLKNDEVCTTKDAMRRMHFGEPMPYVPLLYASELGSVDHEACLKNAAIDIDDVGKLSIGSDSFICGPAALKRMGSANPNLSAIGLAYLVGETIS